VFAIETFLKIIALTPKKYLSKNWNIFDIVIVILSIGELFLEGVKGLSILRSFRLVVIFM
jgi:hypothetical protein